MKPMEKLNYYGSTKIHFVINENVVLKDNNYFKNKMGKKFRI